MATKRELLEDNADLRTRLDEAEDTLRAIRHGEVDALMVSGPKGDMVYTLKGADHPYRILVETISEGTVTLLASDGTIFYANRVLAEMLKMPLEKFIGSSFHDYVPLPERQWFEALLSKGKQGTSRGEMHLRTADGALVPAYISLSSMRLEAVPEALCLAVTDLTEQKRQEEIVSSGRLSRAILEQAEHAIVVCDAHGIITQASRAVHHLFSGNPLLRRFEEVFPLRLRSHGNGAEPSEKAFFLAPVLQGKVKRDVEASFRCLDGRDYHLLLDAGPIINDKGVVLGCVVVLTDITTRKQQEVERQNLLEQQRALVEELASTNEELQVQAEELASTNEELQAQAEELEVLNNHLQVQKHLLETANDEMESFSYSVSHDLKAPVRAIDGFARILEKERGDKLDTEGLRLLQVIRSNAKFMATLIDDLMALSRLGRMQIRKSVVNLAAMTSLIFKQLQAEDPNRDLHISIDDLPPALGDQSLIHQVMMNLLANSIKFTESKPTAIIEVGGRTESKENIYYVKDNGVGFDDRYISNLFRPFKRLHSSEEYEGTGIGLAIVKRIIQRHGGRVWAEGKVNGGATFYFALPKNSG